MLSPLPLVLKAVHPAEAMKIASKGIAVIVAMVETDMAVPTIPTTPINLLHPTIIALIKATIAVPDLLEVAREMVDTVQETLLLHPHYLLLPRHLRISPALMLLLDILAVEEVDTKVMSVDKRGTDAKVVLLELATEAMAVAEEMMEMAMVVEDEEATMMEETEVVDVEVTEEAMRKEEIAVRGRGEVMMHWVDMMAREEGVGCSRFHFSSISLTMAVVVW
jgi:hypothetical protein